MWAASDDRPLACRAAAWCEHQPPGRGDLPRPRRASGDQDEAVALEQHERLCDEVRSSLPRCGACRSDLVGTDSFSVVLMLGVAERTEGGLLSKRAKTAGDASAKCP